MSNMQCALAGLLDSPYSRHSSPLILMTSAKPLAQPRVPITVLNLSLNHVGNNEAAHSLGCARALPQPETSLLYACETTRPLP